LKSFSTLQSFDVYCSDEFSTEGVEMQIFHHQHQRTPALALVAYVLVYGAETWLGVRHEHTGDVLHAISTTGTRYTLVGSYVQCRSAAEINHLSTIDGILRHRRISV